METTTQLNLSDKVKLAEAIFKSRGQDLGGKSVEKAIEAVAINTTYELAERDPITSLIVGFINSSQDAEDIKSNFNYVIGQLKDARQVVNNFEEVKLLRMRANFLDISPAGYGHKKITIEVDGKKYTHTTNDMRLTDKLQSEDEAEIDAAEVELIRITMKANNVTL